jgi:hypothetical protein
MNAEHPDLVEIDRQIRHHLDRVLRAEQEAADLARRRSTTLRDRLIDLEDQCDAVVISHRDDEIVGLIDVVGADHLEIVTASGRVLISLTSIVAVRLL